MQIEAIVNPLSGTGLDQSAAARRVDLLQQMLRRAGTSARIHVTERGGHAAELAAAAAASGADLVIVWGGDGTLNESGAALISSRTAIGLIPAGSGNGLAAALGTPRDPHAAIAAILSGRTRTIDAGMLGHRAFFNVAGIGFDARIASLFNKRSRGQRGRWPYIAIGLREGCRYVGRQYDVRLDDSPYRMSALLIAFANGREYGMGARIAPQALLDDGLLEATVVEDRSIVARFWHARHLALGSVLNAPRVIVRQVRRASVESDGPLEFHVDGEPGLAGNRLDIRIVPGALRVAG